MGSIFPPTTDKQDGNKPKPANLPIETNRTNELTELAKFIRAHSRTAFDVHLSALLAETGNEHDLWSGNCSTPHWHDDLPCDEYERSVSMGIAWIKARIEDGAANAS